MSNSLVFLPLQILLISLDLLISILTFGWIKVIQTWTKEEPLRTVPLDDKDPSHRVHAQFRDKRVTTMSNGAATLHDVASLSFQKFSNHICMRKREFLGWKTPKIKEFGKIQQWTYQEIEQQTLAFGVALRLHGCVPSDPQTTLDKVTKPCRIAIFENTCSEWMIAALGAFSQSIAVATVYATLGMDAVVEAVNDNVIPIIVCNKTHVKPITEMKAQNRMPSLKVIVYTNDLVSKTMDISLEGASPFPKGLQVFSFDDFLALGSKTDNQQLYPVTPPTADTTAVVMYTSGSTGKPKGVVIPHSCVIAGVCSAEYLLHLTPADKYLAYLPLAHIMELMVEFVILANGCSLNYADPKSLTATGAWPRGALEEFRPTHMVAVPKIWDTIKKGLLAKVASSSPVAQVLVHTALSWRSTVSKLGLDTPLFNVLVFKKFKMAVGGELRWALSGGGPLNGEVQEFIRVAFQFPLVQGYGLTETCAGLTIQAEDDDRPNVAGVVIPACEVKLVSTPDVCDKGGLPYLSTDRKDVEGNSVWGRGEICVKGGVVTAGYYMMPDKTKEVFDDNGWFYTGDIGQFLSDGSIRIVDRKKNLVKLKSGEYVALEKMEMVYGNSEFVDAVAGGICCYADGDMDRPVAMMQLNEPVAMKWAKQHGVAGDFADVLKSKELYAAVMESMNKEHAKSDLSHIEKLQAVALIHDPWTPENGCLTAANKLQRRVVIDSFPKEFETIKKMGIF